MEKLNDEEKNKQESSQNNQNELTEEHVDMLEQMTFGNKLRPGETIKDNYKFWDTQPVPSFKSQKIEKIGPIDETEDWDALRKTPYNLPKGFSWEDVDIKNKNDLKEVSFL